MKPTIIYKQRGVMLLEALIGILIFSLGVLALVGMQAAALRGVADARYRTQAASFADQILQQITLNATRDATTTNINQSSIAGFAYQASGSNCAYSGGTSDSTGIISSWASQITNTLPYIHANQDGAPAYSDAEKKAMQQVSVSQPDTDTNQVTVTVCWQGPEDAAPRKHTLTSYIN